MYRLKRTKHREGVKRGAATVEFAICLPVLVAISFATIDICSVIYLKESLTIAAYEGARVGMMAGGTNSTAIDRVCSVLDERSIRYTRSSAITISTPGFNDAPELAHVAVKISVPAQDNTISLSRLFFGKQIEAEVVCIKQFKNES